MNLLDKLYYAFHSDYLCDYKSQRGKYLSDEYTWDIEKIKIVSPGAGLVFLDKRIFSEGGIIDTLLS